MRFGNQDYLNLLWLLIPLIVFLIWSYKNKKRLVEVFLGKSLVYRLLDPQVLKRVKIDNMLTISAVFFFIMALSQPRWGFYWKDLEQKGVDIIICLLYTSDAADE